MFIGQYRHSLDSKKRLIIPAKFRDSVGSEFIVTKWLDGCLTIYAEDAFEAMVKKLQQIPATKSEARQMVRNITSYATECSLDNQGRIQLPQFLIDAVKIQKSCVIVGVADHIEIWPEETWDAYDEEASASFESVAETLTEYLQ